MISFSHFLSFLRLIVLGMCCVGSVSWAQTCGIPGLLGAGAGITGVVNAYYAGTGSPTAGVSSITLASANGQRSNTRGLVAGDLVLIMQMQDSVTPANAGLYEYAQLAFVSGTTIGLTRPLINAYFQTMNTTNVRNWQLVYVPQYSSLTIAGTVSADRFTSNTVNGQATGGVVAIDVAGSMTLTGTITAAGSGFRGGAGLNGSGTRAGGTYTDANYDMTTTVASVNGGFKGEGIEGTPFFIFDGTATPLNYFNLLGQGYATGAGGRAARSNGGGGSNDGDPPTTTGTPATGNKLNSGGGGGSNAGTGGRGGNSWNRNDTATAKWNLPLGGNTGNEAGGLGGNALTNSATRLVFGGGGGAGSINDAGGANAVTTWPPATSTVANGADQGISVSGASGGGVVLLRAGTLGGSGVIDADGYHAFNTSNVSDGAGGGGGGGSIFVTTASGTGAGLTLRARGGWGGRSNYFNHGPGGGGGGGYINTNLTAATTDVSPGQNGQDACCGGTAGNGSPKAYNATPGTAGSLVNTGSANGVSAGSVCLPNITVSKSTSTPLISSATGATVGYSISISNSGGYAIGADFIDNALPPGWTWASTSSVTFAPALSGTSLGGFVESTTAGAPAVAVSPGTVANFTTNGTPAGSPTWANMTLPGINNGTPGRATLNFVANVPNTATVGCYHNPAGVKYIDPTRITAGREITPLTNNTANRSGAQVGGTANTTYETNPGVTNVAGSNYSGLPGGSTAEDVCLQGDLSITKTVTPTAVIAGNTVTYTLVATNAGRGIADIDYTTNQANTVTNATTATAILPSGVLRVTDTLPTGVTVVTAFAGTGWNCTQTGQLLSCDRTTPVPVAALGVIGTITGGVLTTAGVCPGPINNTATLVPLQSPYTETSVVNNTGSSAAVTTTCSANISVTKTNTVTSLMAGGTTVYAITYANAGPSDASGAVVRDTPSAGLSACSVTGCTASGGNPAASCPAAGNWPNIFTGGGLSLPSLPSGASIRFTVGCNVTATGI